MTYIPGYSPPRRWRKLALFDVLLLAGCCIAGIFFLGRAMAVTDHLWDWSALGPWLLYQDATGNWHSGNLMRGLYFTVRLGAWAMLVALISGGLIGVLSAHHRGMATLPATIYINVMRNTPPLVLLFLVFFFAGSFFTAPLLHLESLVAQAPPVVQHLFAIFISPPGQLDRIVAAVLTLGLYEGAYVAEIVRAGIESVPKGQYEAAASQGLSPRQQYRYVIMPQALRLMVPPLVGQTISTFKETALASIISLPELTFQSLEVMAVTRMTFELWLATAAIYLLLSCIWSALGRLVENRRRWH